MQPMIMDQGYINFYDHSATLAYGYLTYDYQGKTIHKETPYMDPLTRSGEPHYKYQGLSWTTGAKNIRIELKAHSVTALQSCTMSISSMRGNHSFEISGTLFGHWYYWDHRTKASC